MAVPNRKGVFMYLMTCVFIVMPTYIYIYLLKVSWLVCPNKTFIDIILWVRCEHLWLCWVRSLNVSPFICAYFLLFVVFLLWHTIEELIVETHHLFNFWQVANCHILTLTIVISTCIFHQPKQFNCLLFGAFFSFL